MRGHIKTNQDWWIAAICIRIEPVGCDVRDGRKRNTTWVDHHLIHAKTLAEAYDKAVVIGRRSEMKCEARRGWMQDRRFVCRSCRREQRRFKFLRAAHKNRAGGGVSLLTAGNYGKINARF